MTIIGILLKASVLLLAALVAHVLIGRRASAASRHLLWTLAMGGLLVLPILSGVVPAWAIADIAPPRAAQFVQTTGSRVTRIASEMTSSLAVPAVRPSAGSSATRNPWSTFATVFYAIGVVALLLRLLAQRWFVRRLTIRAKPVIDPVWTGLLDETAASLNLRRRIALLRTLEETMPMAVGTRCPAIVIPALADTWSHDRRRSVLLHELAHVARYDCLTQSLAAIVCAIYWIHPGAWWAARRLRIEREMACDDRVLAAGADAGDYATDLLEFAYSLRVDTAPALMVTMSEPRQLEGRLRALLDGGRNRKVPGLRNSAAMAVLAVALAGTIAAARLGPIGVQAFAAGVPLLQIAAPPRQTFEVASVRPNKSIGTGGYIQRRPGGSFSVGNQTLQTLILFAYQIQGFQLVGAPNWIATERFDIVAKAASDVPPTPFGGTPPEALMLRSLLEDRFRLTVHRETRDMPIYALVVARSDGRLGPRLRRPTSDYCARQFEAAGKPGAAPPPEGSPVCGINGSNNALTAGSFPLSAFASFLAGQARRIVVDRTGLNGVWDFDLKWSPPDTPNADPDHPSIFTALEEQLGLRLDAATGPVEVLVIDRIEALIPD
jgi:bla regulator protein blaR1